MSNINLSDSGASGIQFIKNDIQIKKEHNIIFIKTIKIKENFCFINNNDFKINKSRKKDNNVINNTIILGASEKKKSKYLFPIF